MFYVSGQSNKPELLFVDWWLLFVLPQIPCYKNRYNYIGQTVYDGNRMKESNEHLSLSYRAPNSRDFQPVEACLSAKAGMMNETLVR